jgi:hypothetical protein
MREDDIRTVLQKAETARALLSQKEEELQREIDQIDDIEWDRPLTDAERGRRKEKRAAQTATRAAKIELSFITLRALDQHPEVLRLVNAFRSINQDLGHELGRLNEIAEAAATTAKVLDALADFAADLAKLLAS